MGYKENIKLYEREIERLEYEKSEAERMRKSEESGGKEVTIETYDPVNDHIHYDKKITKPSARYIELTDKIMKLETRINELKQKLELARKMAPEEEKKEKELATKTETRKKEKEETEKEVDTLRRNQAMKEIKLFYKMKISLPRRIALALQGRKPKWKKIKQSATDELEFLSKAGNTTAGYKIETRDKLIQDTLRTMGHRKNVDPDEYAERKRREYFLKLLQTKRFLEEEKTKNSANPKMHM